VADLFVAEQVAKGQPDTQDLRTAIREELITRELFAQEARKKGLEKNAETQARIEIARQGVLVSVFIDQYLKDHPISESALKAEYERQLSLLGPTEYKLRHILLKTEAEASAIILRLQHGEKFEALVAQSLDDASRKTGGDLGWTRPNTFPESLRTAVIALKPGTYTTTPLSTNNGYHVIMLDDTRKIEAPDYDKARERIRQGMVQDAIKKLGAELRAAAKIE